MLDVGTLPCGFAGSEPLPCCWDPCVLWIVTVDPPLHFDPGDFPNHKYCLILPPSSSKLFALLRQACVSLLVLSALPSSRERVSSESLRALPLGAAPSDPSLWSCSAFSGAKPCPGLLVLCDSSQGWGCRIPYCIPKRMTKWQAGQRTYTEQSKRKGNLKQKCYQWAK